MKNVLDTSQSNRHNRHSEPGGDQADTWLKGLDLSRLGSLTFWEEQNGGRPDLAEDALNKVEAPTLLIVGGEDRTVLDLNGRAAKRMHCLNRLHIIPGATHLFEEPGALEQVAAVAGDWFTQHMQDRRVLRANKEVASNG